MREKVNFSIVIPVKNGANYLAETLRSVFAQTYTHFNLIILENCSEDNTLEIVASFKDSRLSVVPSVQPLSIENNWARMLNLNLNEYLVLLCHDDLLAPDFLAEITHLIETYPDASLYHTQFYFVDQYGSKLGQCQPVNLQERADEFLGKLLRFKEDAFGSAYVMRGADFKRVGGYPNYPRLLFSDFACYYQLTELSYKVCSPKFLASFRGHASSATRLAKMAEFVQAAQRYIADLKQTSYFRQATQIHIAYQFIIEGFIRSNYRQLLDSAIRQSGDRQFILQECSGVKTILIKAYQADPDFLARNFPTKLYEQINHISHRGLRLIAYSVSSPILKTGLSIVRQIRLIRRIIALRREYPQ